MLVTGLSIWYGRKRKSTGSWYCIVMVQSITFSQEVLKVINDWIAIDLKGHKVNYDKRKQNFDRKCSSCCPQMDNQWFGHKTGTNTVWKAS